MASKARISILIFVIAGLIAAFWIINKQLNITTNAIDQEVAANINQVASVKASQNTLAPETGMVISVVGATPVEPVKHSVDKKKEKTVFQSTGSASSSASSSASVANQSVSGSTAPAAVDIIKEPTVEKKKEMSSKGIIIF